MLLDAVSKIRISKRMPICLSEISINKIPFIDINRLYLPLLLNQLQWFSTPFGQAFVSRHELNRRQYARFNFLCNTYIVNIYSLIRMNQKLYTPKQSTSFLSSWLPPRQLSKCFTSNELLLRLSTAKPKH